ncbi:MAG: penicillin-binding protein 2 [Alphaproteobacteria bacterium]|nr:penicillin-binding protein 2 [Alphaproteobacteria bacterium]
MTTLAAFRPRAPQPVAPPPSRAVRLEGAAKQVLESSRGRLTLTAGVFAIAFAVVGMRLVDLATSKPAMEAREFELPRANDSAGYAADRADIVDRSGALVATSVPTASLYADPRDILDPHEAATKLATILPEIKSADLAARLSVEGRSFVWIRRNLTPRQQYEINRLGIPGFYFQREDKRIYPHGSLMAHAVGFADVDGKGLGGVEQAVESKIKGGREPIQLSIDIRLQHIVRQELQTAIGEFNAIGGSSLIMDARTGEILSMVSLPDFDPNAPGAAPADNRFNRNTLGVYEMGSTFKTFTIAMALDAGTATMRSSFDAREPIRISRFAINDDHAQKRWLTVPEVYKHSSNIGAAKIALEVGAEGQKSFMRKMGMLDPVQLELPELGKPRYPRDWRPINVITIAFGHGLSVTPIHLASGVATVVNGGVLHPPTLLKRKEGEPAPGRQVLKASTSDGMRRLMRLVVEEGTGKKADAAGYWIGGKTGTAEKVSRGGYKKSARLSSFIAAFPIYDPRYVVIVMVDEPKGTKKSFGFATGGWVAAPVVRRIVQRMGPLVGLPPTEETPEIRRLLMVDSQPQTKEEKRVAAR